MASTDVKSPVTVRRAVVGDASTLAEAAGRGKDAVWLGVWERNARAIRFYEEWDFHPAGTQPFLLGTDLQTDLVMVRRIARES
jgi:ribosomal protein S18 acetylase RimI-like enzyme